jgi:hypothetical protein
VGSSLFINPFVNLGMNDTAKRPDDKPENHPLSDWKGVASARA